VFLFWVAAESRAKVIFIIFKQITLLIKHDVVTLEYSMQLRSLKMYVSNPLILAVPHLSSVIFVHAAKLAVCIR
jgi:hypothetical protein